MLTAPLMADPFALRIVVEPLARGPLSGATFAVKDLFDVAGTRTGCGNPTWAATHAVATRHAAVVQRLLCAGARLLGKTRTDEMAYSLDGSNFHEGAPPNPAAPDRLTGGSSSGSASAAAAGDVDFAIGTDTAGSVRVPAAWCGLHGLRPTHGCIDTQGLTPLAPSFDVVGWFARSAVTLRQVGDALLSAPPPAPREFLLLRAPAVELDVDVQVKDAVHAVFTRCAAHAHATRELSLPVSLHDVAETLRVLQAAEAWRMHAAWINAARPVFGAGVAARFAMAKSITADEVKAASAQRAAILTRLDAALPPGSVLLLPAVPGPPPLRVATVEQLQAQRSRIFPLTALASLSGRPQLTVPVRGADGLPVGAGLLGWRGGDAALLQVAASIAC